MSPVYYIRKLDQPTTPSVVWPARSLILRTTRCRPKTHYTSHHVHALCSTSSSASTWKAHVWAVRRRSHAAIDSRLRRVPVHVPSVLHPQRSSNTTVPGTSCGHSQPSSAVPRHLPGVGKARRGVSGRPAVEAGPDGGICGLLTRRRVRLACPVGPSSLRREAVGVRRTVQRLRCMSASLKRGEQLLRGRRPRVLVGHCDRGLRVETSCSALLLHHRSVSSSHC
jgi:hypothetical protein